MFGRDTHNLQPVAAWFEPNRGEHFLVVLRGGDTPTSDLYDRASVRLQLELVKVILFDFEFASKREMTRRSVDQIREPIGGKRVFDDHRCATVGCQRQTRDKIAGI